MSDSSGSSQRLQELLSDLPLEELAFAPVPVKPRHDGWTPERQRGFIQRLALCGCAGTAAGSVGKSRESAYRLRARAGGESFAAAWDKALDWGERRIADVALERAILGDMEPVFYRGRRVGERTRYNTSLLIAMLDRADRRERHRVSAAADAHYDPVAELSRLLDEIHPEPH